MAVVKKTFAAVLIAAAAVGIGLALSFFLPQEIPQKPGDTIPTEAIDTAVHISFFTGFIALKNCKGGLKNHRKYARMEGICDNKFCVFD